METGPKPLCLWQSEPTTTLICFVILKNTRVLHYASLHRTVNSNLSHSTDENLYTVTIYTVTHRGRNSSLVPLTQNQMRILTWSNSVSELSLALLYIGHLWQESPRTRRDTDDTSAKYKCVLHHECSGCCTFVAFSMDKFIIRLLMEALFGGCNIRNQMFAWQCLNLVFWDLRNAFLYVNIIDTLALFISYFTSSLSLVFLYVETALKYWHTISKKMFWTCNMLLQSLHFSRR